MIKGQCLCGAVQYQYQGEIENSILCYCTDCQQALLGRKMMGLNADDSVAGGGNRTPTLVVAEWLGRGRARGRLGLSGRIAFGGRLGLGASQAKVDRRATGNQHRPQQDYSCL